MLIDEQWKIIIGRPNLGNKFTEKQLQEYIGERLKKFGFSAQFEVRLNGGKADIVTDWLEGTIIEVKKIPQQRNYISSGWAIVTVWLKRQADTGNNRIIAHRCQR